MNVAKKAKLFVRMEKAIARLPKVRRAYVKSAWYEWVTHQQVSTSPCGGACDNPAHK